MLGDSHPFKGEALEGNPALILKLCNNLSGSSDFKYPIFKSSRRFIHDGVRVTDIFENGTTFSASEINGTF